MKKIFYVLLLVLIISPFSSLFAQYHSGDLSVLLGIQSNNFSAETELNWTSDPNPGNWDGIVWDNSSPKRISELRLGEYGQGKSINVNTGFQGAMDLRGLDSMKYLFLFRNINLYNLDIRNLPSLIEVYCPRTGLKTIEASNCKSLTVLKCKKSNLIHVDVAGCNNLVSLECAENGITSLDLDSLENLIRVEARENNMASLNLSGCISLDSLDVGRNLLTFIDVTGLTNLSYFDAERNKLNNIKNIDTINLNKLFINNNLLSFKRAVQLQNHATSTVTNALYQLGYAPQSVAINDSVDFSDVDSFLVNGAMASTSFTLFNAGTGATIATNNTGIFQMTAAGAYYVRLINSGYAMNSGTILVDGGLTPDASFSSSDYTILMNIQSANIIGGNYNWGGVTDLTQMTGVVWDTTITPKRVAEINLSDNGSSKSSGTAIIVAGTIDFTGLDSLHKLEIVKQPSVVGIDVTGLHSINRLFLARTAIQVLDLTGNLSPMFLNIAGSNVKAVNLTGCANLDRVKLKKSINLSSLILTGCTSIRRAALRETGLSHLDISGFTNVTSVGAVRSRLQTLNAAGCTSMTKTNCRNSYISNLDLTGNNNMTLVRCSRNRLTSIDLTNKNVMLQVRAGRNKIDDIPSYLGPTGITRFRVPENRLTLTEAAQIYTITTLNNRNVLDQDPYPPVTILITDSIDHSIESSIMINGAAVQSNFISYTSLGIPVDTNITGVFHFDTVGTYYITMFNSGVYITTGLITVIDTANPLIDASVLYDFGDVIVDSSKTETMTIYNTGGLNLTVSDIVMPIGFVVSSTTAVVLPGDSTLVNVTFTPTEEIQYNGSILVLSDAVAGTNILNVTGRGYIPLDTLEDSTSVFEQLIIEEQISIHPNPSRNMIELRWDQNALDATQIELDLINAQGRLIRSYSFFSNQQPKINIYDLPNGLYVIQSTDPSLKGLRGKFMKY